MHLADFSVGSVGESGIVGSGMPLAVGAALSARLRGTDQVCLCFFGDGAANCGPFHESMNLAVIWKLPVIFLCENNNYAMFTPQALTTSVVDVARRANAYDIPGVVVDGQDVISVYEAVSAAVARARSRKGPTLVEAKTYRYAEHSEVEQLKFKAPRYRADTEIAYWMSRDPIEMFANRLLGLGELSGEERDTMKERVKLEVEEAVSFAENSPKPDRNELLQDLFV